jgi:hypoxanthine phosphoribosyltransferase|tara:strand:- start:210 stop:725 length:516 start_codon:yes stop_codon:yes gene_type:complete
LEQLGAALIMADIEGASEHIVTWAEVHRDTKVLVKQLLAAGPWRGIVAISRGGLVPATILAREMDIRFVDTICIASYDEKDQSAIQLIKKPDEAVGEAGKGWLLVDDLVDTGATMRAAKELLPESHVATVYAKPDGMPFVDTFVHEVAQDVWIFFPWDTDLTYTTPIARGA